MGQIFFYNVYLGYSLLFAFVRLIHMNPEPRTGCSLLLITTIYQYRSLTLADNQHQLYEKDEDLYNLICSHQDNICILNVIMGSQRGRLHCQT